MLKRLIRKKLRALLGERSQVDEATLVHMAENFRAMELNIKAFGYDIAKRLAEALPVPAETAARHVGLASKASTQADIETDWAAHWAREIGAAVVFHRKVWELTYVLQAIYEHGHMRPGARGLGFGCGVEPIPSVLARAGVAVTVTDLEEAEARDRGWVNTQQHSRSLESAFHPNLVDRATFDALVTHRNIDMNAIPDDLAGYDFCWSCCAFEHLGSIDNGLEFIAASLRTLRPGGLSVHTTEFNVDDEGDTLETGPTVLFQRRHFEALAARLRAEGHDVAPFDFDYGDRPMDRFIDIPPWSHGDDALAASMIHTRHLKVGVSRHVATCFGIIVRRAA